MAHSSLLFAAQTSLIPDFDPTEPTQPKILGKTFEPKVDAERLGSQQRRVEELMLDGEWRNLHDIAIALRKLYKTHFPEASISARLRDLRRAGLVVERTRLTPKSGVWLYRVLKPAAQVDDFEALVEEVASRLAQSEVAI